MEAERVKRNCVGKVDNEPNPLAEDRLSQLPDPIIYHIFTFLPTIYIIRMSKLSKHWRWMWVSAPFLYFEDRKLTFHDNVNQQNMCLKFVGNCLGMHQLYRQIPDAFITSFKLQMHYKFGTSVVRRIDNWVKLIIENNVKELDFCGEHYRLPQCVLNASSLTVFKLTNVKGEVPSLSTFPSLKVLSLKRVKFDNMTLQNLILGCPIIEDLQLESFTLRDIDLAVSGTLSLIKANEFY